MKSKGFWIKQSAAGLMLAASWAGAAQGAFAQAVASQYVPIITVTAGTGTAAYTGDGGLATAATLDGQEAPTYDKYGNLFIADSKNNAIRRVDAVTGIITTVAGIGSAGFAGDGAAASAAQLSGPMQVAFDTAGNMYIADSGNNRVREVTALNGMITSTCGCVINTIIGTGGKVAPTAGVAGTATAIYGPRAVVVDPAGDIFVAVGNSNEVVELPFGGLTVKYAGAGGATLTGIGGPAAASTFTVYDLALDTAGNLYITDEANSVVLQVAPGSGSAATGITAPGNITLTAGSLPSGATTGTAGYNGDGIAANTAQLNKPYGTVVDAAGNIYISDTGNYRLRKVNTSNGIISTISGTGTRGRTGSGGAALAATQNTVQIGLSANGALLAVSYSAANIMETIHLPNTFPATAVGSLSAAQNVVAQAQAAGTVSTYGIAPGLPADFTVGIPGGCPGAIAAGAFCSAPVQFTPTAPGQRFSRMLLTDSQNDQYLFGMFGVGQAPSASFAFGNVTFSAGSTGTPGSSGDGGAASSALLNQPNAVALDVNGNLYIADAGNNKVRLVNQAGGGIISTFAGTGAPAGTGDGGVAVSAALNNPSSVSLDAAGDLLIADTGNNRIREVNAQTGVISTIAGTGTSGAAGDGGQASAAQLSAPKGIVADGAGNLYIADTGNNKIRAYDVYLGTITTVAGTGTAGNGGAGVAGSSAALNAPQGVALDSTGNLFIADTGNNVVRALNLTTGVITTVAGNGTAAYSGDGGTALSASLNAPTAVAVDAAGDIYIADSANHVIRTVSAAGGIISTVVGTGVGGPESKNVAALATQMIAPAGLIVDATGNLYVADPKSDAVVFVNGSQPTLSFGIVNQGTTSSVQTATLMNNGNQNLVLSAIVPAPASYRQVTGNSTDCAATTTLAPGASCQVRVTFTPMTLNGSTPGTVTISDNALNSPTSTQVINLSATAVVVGPPTAVKVQSGSGQTTTPLGVFPLPLQVVVTDANGYLVNGATVTYTVVPAGNGAGATFANNATTAMAVTNNNGLATSSGLSANTADGTYTILATVAGVTTPANFTETNSGKLSPKLTASASASALSYGQSVTLTATLTPSSAGSNAVSGTITFLDNGVAISTVNVSSGGATLSYIPGGGTRQITATYSGDGNFSSSITATSVSLTVSPLPVTGTVNSLSLPYGSAVPVLSGTLTGVLPADQAFVVLSLSVPNPPLAVGQYPITGKLTGSAAGNYTLTLTGSPMLTITQAATVTTLSVNNPSPSLGVSVALTATVASTVNQAPAPSGSVTFYNGATSLGMVTLSASGNASTGTLILSTLPAGAQQITAVYSGSTNNLTSTSSALTVTVVAPNFALNATPTAITLRQGDHADIALSAVANQAFSGTLVFSCTGLPANSTCVFTQPTITVGAGTTGSALLQITTGGPSTNQARLDGSALRGDRTLLAIVFLPGLILLGFGNKSRTRSLPRALLLLVLLSAGMLASVSLTGCSSHMTSTNTVLTPTGTATVMVTAQSTVTQTTTVTLNVTVAQ